MWLFDFHVFYLAGQAVLAGISPYIDSTFISPYMLALVFALVAWLPEGVAYALYLAGCGWLMWRVLKKRLIWVLLSFPVIFGLFVGQLDLPLALLGRLLGPWALPLFLVKPQLGFVLAPWIIRRAGWRELASAAGLGAGFVGVSFLLHPPWFAEWLAYQPSLAEYASKDANVYFLLPGQMKAWAVGIGALLALPLGFWLESRRESWVVLHLFQPLTNIYSASVLAEWIGPWEVALSWLAIFWMGDIHAGAPMFLVGLSILIRYRWRMR